jgi:aryl-alcohol dehydrogenase-like predicted oxidoreductase
VLSRRLGGSDLLVSAFALGSWRTFERMGPEQGLQVLEAAREAGITTLDDARYDDETGTAPIPTGYSEVLFGQLFSASGYTRDQVVVSNKLWWEFWPDEDAAAELEGSLGRMGFDDVDLIYATPLPPELSIERAVASIGGLVASDRARAWGVCNWSAQDLERVADVCDATGVPTPCAVQLPYSLLHRDWVEGAAMQQALERTGAAVVASAVLAGGALTGKYGRGGTGRLGGQMDHPAVQQAVTVGAELDELAAQWGTTPAALALGFALGGPRVATVLFGATSAEQVSENVGALELLDRLDDAARERMSLIGR